MSSCGVCLSSSGAEECTGYRNIVVKAGKNWICDECGCNIPKKSLYELASGFNDSSHWQTKTCLVCADIAEALYCGSRWHGQLWDSIDCNIERFNIVCLFKMKLPEAKRKIQTMWVEWLDQEVARKKNKRVVVQ